MNIFYTLFLLLLVLDWALFIIYVPHIAAHPLWKLILPGSGFYFLHKFHAR